MASRKESASVTQLRNSLADPNTLQPLRRKSKDTTSGVASPGEELVQVVIETPRGSRYKYSYDEQQRIFVLKSALPIGMAFPYDFGFVPQTTGGDGDPLDVLVLMEEPCFPGCALLVSLIGVVEVEQTQGGETFRNDRFIAVADVSYLYGHFRTIDELPERFRAELDAFFVQYHKLHGKESRTLAWKGPEEARKLLQSGKR